MVQYMMGLKSMIGKMYRFQMIGVDKFPYQVLTEYRGAPETKADLQVMFEDTQKRRSVNLASRVKPDEKNIKKLGWDIHIIHDPTSLRDDYNLYHTWPC